MIRNYFTPNGNSAVMVGFDYIKDFLYLKVLKGGIVLEVMPLGDGRIKIPVMDGVIYDTRFLDLADRYDIYEKRFTYNEVINGYLLHF